MRYGPFGTNSVDQDRKTIVHKELFEDERLSWEELWFQNQTHLVLTQI